VLYEYAGKIDPNDGPLELKLDGRTLLLDADADGERLRVVEQEWSDPFEEPLSEENRQYVAKHGMWRRVDCSRWEGYSSLVGQEVTEACVLVNEFGRIGGVRISTPAGTLWFVVEGDQSHVHWAKPDSFTERTQADST
jgi:hypothetical protein